MSSKQVWVIDDDAIFRMIVRTIVQASKRAWTVREFPTVQEANQALRESNDVPDAILLDINIPVGGGWLFLEEFEQLRCEKGNSPLYVCSSSINVNDKQRAAESLCVKRFVEKPLPFDFFDTLEG
jgi:CheY-like chemotaxis protein